MAHAWSIAPALLALGLAVAAPALATTWVVREDGSGDAPTIEEAVEITSPGDTVLVTDGSYNRANGNLFKGGMGVEYAAVHMPFWGIVLRSENGPASTIIDVSPLAPEDHPARGINCEFSDPATVIEGFTIRGGNQFFGAGIQIYSGGVQVRGNVILENVGGSGSAIFVTGGATVVLAGNRFERNHSCCGIGGAIYVEASQAEITGNVFVENVCLAPGGALAFGYGATGLVADNEFTSNQGMLGGAVYVNGSSPEIRRNVFTGNQATLEGGGAAAYEGPCGGLFAENVMTDNLAVGNGGALYLNDSSPPVFANTMRGNSGVNGGGIFLTGAASPPITGVLVAFNHGVGGVFVDGAGPAPTFSCCDVFGNDGEQYVGLAAPTGQNGNLSCDPLLCERSSYLQRCSPLRMDSGSSCGQIGALGADCACLTPPPALPEDTWGSVKWTYR